MSTPFTTQSDIALLPARGIREFSIPGDPSNNGTSGIHYNRILKGSELLAWMPVNAGGPSQGGLYGSPIHGGLGSDMTNPALTLPAGFNVNPAVPAFAGPEVTGYYTTGPNAQNPKTNGIYNTEKIQRSASDTTAAGGATVWQGLQGRNHLNINLWIQDTQSVGAIDGEQLVIELYRDLSPADKIATIFGATGGVFTNAQLLAQWMFLTTSVNQKQPNCVVTDVPLPAGCNLYLLYRNLVSHDCYVVGSIFLS